MTMRDFSLLMIEISSVEDNEEVFGLEVNGKIFDSYISKDEVLNDMSAILYGAKLELEKLTKQIDKLVKMLVEQS